MTKLQALTVARRVLAALQKTEFWDEKEQAAFEKEYGVRHAQIVNAFPIIEAMEIVEGATE